MRRGGGYYALSMQDMTALLESASRGDTRSANALFQLVYEDLKELAARRLRNEPPGQTLQPTALVHESYLRLIGGSAGDLPIERKWDGEHHFFAAAAEAMRRILVESARRKRRRKHGGALQRVGIDPATIGEPETAEEILALDEALGRLAQVQPQLAELVRLRFFAGLPMKQIATLLGIAPRTADAHWAYARAWLLAEIQSESRQEGPV